MLVQLDPRFEHVVGLVRQGEFGWEDYFAPLMDSVTGKADYYLVANDFASYIDAQVRAPQRRSAHFAMPSREGC